MDLDALHGKKGAYRIGELIGQGAMGDVYLAQAFASQPETDAEGADTSSTNHGKACAVKILKETALEENDRREVLARFLREAETASRLKYRHIVQVLDYGSWGGTTFLVMEAIESPTLEKLIQEAAGGCQQGEKIAVSLLPASFIKEVARQILEALVCIHRHSLVHRDLKPSNIFAKRGDDPDVQVTDFGVVHDPNDGDRLTKTGETVGTPCIMSPEQIEEPPGDHRADIWAFGAVLYNCMTGHFPFEVAPSENVFKLLTKIVGDEPHTPLTAYVKDPDELLASIIERCLQKDPDKRYQFVQQILEDLSREDGQRRAICVPRWRRLLLAFPPLLFLAAYIFSQISRPMILEVEAQPLGTHTAEEPAPQPTSSPVVTPLAPVPEIEARPQRVSLLTDRKAKTAYGMGSQLFEKRDLLKAEQEFSIVVEREPGYAPAYLLLAQCSVLLRGLHDAKAKDAVRMYRRLEPSKPLPPLLRSLGD